MRRGLGGRVRRLRAAAIPAAFVFLASCAKDAPQDTFDVDGPIAQKIDHLQVPVFLVAGAVFVLVQALLIITVVKHRHRPGRPDPIQVHGNTKLEFGWTVVPALLLVGVAFPTVFTIFDLSKEPTKNVLPVEVYGHLWWWEYIYPTQDGISAPVNTANELHIPVGRPVRLTLRTVEPGLPNNPEGELAQGVIHSFWVPKLAGKQDVVPGRDNKLTIEADEPGQKYLGQCAEYCNLSHANMRLAVVTHTEEDFAAWVADQSRPAAQPSSGLAAQGFEVFTGAKGGCLACHSVNGIEGAVSRVGPNLTHLKSRDRFAGYIFDNTQDNLRRWVADPPAMKPMRPDKGTGMPDQGLSDQEVEAVVAYLETLQ